MTLQWTLSLFWNSIQTDMLIMLYHPVHLKTATTLVGMDNSSLLPDFSNCTSVYSIVAIFSIQNHTIFELSSSTDEMNIWLKLYDSQAMSHSLLQKTKYGTGHWWWMMVILDGCPFRLKLSPEMTMMDSSKKLLMTEKLSTCIILIFECSTQAKSQIFFLLEPIGSSELFWATWKFNTF